MLLEILLKICRALVIKCMFVIGTGSHSQIFAFDAYSLRYGMVQPQICLNIRLIFNVYIYGVYLLHTGYSRS